MDMRNNERCNVFPRVNFSQSETSSLLRGGLNSEILLWGRVNRKDPNKKIKSKYNNHQPPPNLFDPPPPPFFANILSMIGLFYNGCGGIMGWGGEEVRRD